MTSSITVLSGPSRLYDAVLNPTTGCTGCCREPSGGLGTDLLEFEQAGLTLQECEQTCTATAGSGNCSKFYCLLHIACKKWHNVDY